MTIKQEKNVKAVFYISFSQSLCACACVSLCVCVFARIECQNEQKDWMTGVKYARQIKTIARSYERRTESGLGLRLRLRNRMQMPQMHVSRVVYARSVVHFTPEMYTFSLSIFVSFLPIHAPPPLFSFREDSAVPHDYKKTSSKNKMQQNVN